MKKGLLLILSILFISAGSNRLKSGKGKNLHIPEPSDICQAADGGYFVVSDNGFLYKIKSDYSIELKSEKFGFDYEGVCANDSEVYVSDESLRQIVVYNAADLKLKSVKYFNYQGGRNLGMESLTYNPLKKKYIGFSEKNPCLLFEFDESFNMTNQMPIAGLREVSSVTYNNGFIWILSDEEMEVYKVDPITYKIISNWDLGILNPEGITFTKDGKLLIVSDDMEELFEISMQNL